MEPHECLTESHALGQTMDSLHDHEELLHLILHSTYLSSSSGSSSSCNMHLTPAEKQTLLLTLQQVSKSVCNLINSNCKGMLGIKFSKLGAHTPEAWLARHGHLLAELHVGKGMVQRQRQLAAIARGLHAANARPGGLQLQVFTGHASGGMAAVLAKLQGSSQHLTRLELLPAGLNDDDWYDDKEQHICFQVVKHLLPHLQQLQVLTVKLGCDVTMFDMQSFVPRRTLSVGHLSHLTSLKFGKALVSSSDDLPSSLQQLQLDPVDSSRPLMQPPAGLRSVHLNLGWIETSTERQQLLDQVAAQCTSLKEVGLKYQGHTGPILISRGEMDVWALLPVCMLHVVWLQFADQETVQLFPQLLAATHKHLTSLHFDCINADAVKGLPVGLAQLTGLRKLHLEIGKIAFSSERQKLLKQLAAQCTSLREVGLEYSNNWPADALEEGEMAAWALLPMHSLELANISIRGPTHLQQFPQLLAVTHQHLSKLTLVCPENLVAERLHVGLAQLTGLVTLQLSGIPPAGLEQLFEVVVPQLVKLRHLKLMDMHVPNAVMQHLSARSLMRVYLFNCTWDDGVDDELKSRLKYVTLEEDS